MQKKERLTSAYVYGFNTHRSLTDGLLRACQRDLGHGHLCQIDDR